MKKKSKVDSITMDEWIGELFPYSKEVPEGAISVEEICKKTGLVSSTVRGRMIEEERKGNVKIFRIKDGHQIKNYYLKIK